MKVIDFVNMAKDDYLYTIVDASKTGYLGKNKTYLSIKDGEYGYRVIRCWGECELIGFDIATKRRLFLYIKE